MLLNLRSTPRALSNRLRVVGGHGGGGGGGQLDSGEGAGAEPPPPPPMMISSVSLFGSVVRPSA